MSLGPALYPCDVSMSDGSLQHPSAQVFLTYSEETGEPTRVRVHVIGAGNQIVTALDEPVASFTEGEYPTMVHGRHQAVLADGRVLHIMLERGHGGCCGVQRQLRGFRPGNPPTSGYRP